MSADNWDICPRCIETIGLEKATHDSTFREDYEIYGAQHGEIEVHYKGQCKACGLHVEFDHRRNFFSPAKQEQPMTDADVARRSEYVMLTNTLAMTDSRIASVRVPAEAFPNGVQWPYRLEDCG